MSTKLDLKPVPEEKKKLSDILTRITIDTEGLIEGQTPLRIVGKPFKETIQGVKIDWDAHAKAPADRKNFYFVKPADVPVVIKRQYQKYFNNPAGYGMSDNSTLKQVIEKFDQENPINKINKLEEQGINVNDKVKDIRKKYDLSRLNPFAVTDAHADETVPEYKGLDLTPVESPVEQSVKYKGLNLEPLPEVKDKGIHPVKFIQGAIAKPITRSITTLPAQVVSVFQVGLDNIRNIAKRQLKNDRAIFGISREEFLKRTPEQQSRIDINNRIVESLNKIEDNSRQVQQEFMNTASTGWMARDPKAFKGSFMENPSWTRALASGFESASILVLAATVSAISKSPTAGASIVGSLEAADEYNIAIANGLTTEEASGIFLSNLVVLTALETVPLTSWMKGGKLPVRMFRTALQEGGEEILQGLWKDSVAKYGYDETRSLTENLVESFIAGSISGGVIGTFSPNTNLQKQIPEAKSKGVDVDKMIEVVGKQVVNNADEIRKRLIDKMKGTPAIPQEAVQEPTQQEVLPVVTPEIETAQKAGKVIGIDAKTKLPIIDTTQKGTQYEEEKAGEAKEGLLKQQEVLRDKENIERLPGQKPRGEEPIQAELDVTTGEEAVGPSGDVQTRERELEVKEQQAEYANKSFYSKLEKTIEEKMSPSATPEQVRGIIKNAGIRQEEIDWIDVEGFIKDKPKITKQELVDYVRQNQVLIEEVEKKELKPEFLKNLAEYRNLKKDMESLEMTPLSIRDSNELKAIGERMNEIDSEYEGSILSYDNKRTNTKFSKWQEPGGKNYKELLLKLPENPSDERDVLFMSPEERQKVIESRESDNFLGGHFDEPNVLAHVRMNDRKDSEGNKVLFLEEVQSDWHQKGRAGETVPDAPFKKSWHELAMKRMLRYASENGYDKLAWTTGEQQAARYYLSKHIDRLLYRKLGENTFDIVALKNDKQLILKNDLSKEELSQHVGKDLAQKIIDDSGHTLINKDDIRVYGENYKQFSDLDLKVGGEGMKGFYDKIIPSFINNYAKKWGARVSSLELPEVGTVHSVAITPSMRQSVMTEGQPLFEKGGEYGKLKEVTPSGQVRPELRPPAKTELFQDRGELFSGKYDVKPESEVSGGKKELSNKERNIKVATPEGGLPVFESPFALKWKETGFLQVPSQTVTSPADIAFAFQFLKDEAVENFYLGAVKDGQIVAVELLSIGTINQANPHNFEQFNLLDKTQADGYFVVHNHPSGKIEPSIEDKRFTQKLIEVLNQAGFRFDGHIIIDTENFSLIREDLSIEEFKHKEYAEKKNVPVLKKYLEWHRDKSLAGPKIKAAEDVFEIAKGIKRGDKDAVLFVLNNQNVIMNAYILPQNKINVGNIQKMATRQRGNSVILINSGLKITDVKEVKRLLNNSGITFLDDIVHDPSLLNVYTSRADKGVLNEKGAGYNISEQNLIPLIRRHGGIDIEKAALAGYPYETFKEFGLLGVLKKGGSTLDNIATELKSQNLITGIDDNAPGDSLMEMLKENKRRAIASIEKNLDKEYEKWLKVNPEITPEYIEQVNKELDNVQLDAEEADLETIEGIKNFLNKEEEGIPVEKEIEQRSKEPSLKPPPALPPATSQKSLPTPDNQGTIKSAGQLIQYYLGTKEERWKALFGEVKGRKIFEMLRFFDRAINLASAEVERRNIQIFKGINLKTRERIFEVLKGIRGIDENGLLEFGALQPSGIVSNSEEKTYSKGEELEDGRIVGEETEPESGEFMTYRFFHTEAEYTELIKDNPRAREIIEKYLSINEELKKTILGTDIPAFSREVLKQQFDIKTRQPEGFSYVPSVKKEQRLFARIKNIFRSYTAGGRKFKTGRLAESGLEEQDILKAYTLRQQELSYENLFNDMAGNIMALVLEPIQGRKIKPGYVQVNINHPRVIKITELKKELFKANGIDPDKLSLFQYPEIIERELKIQSTAQFHNESLEKAHNEFKNFYNTLIRGITTNYLIRPSTTNRNFVSGFIQYNLKTLTHFYEGLLGRGFIPLSEDIKALYGAVTPQVRKLLPAEVLGGMFFSDITNKKSIFHYPLAPFRAVEYFFKRASFLADLNTFAQRAFMNELKAGTITIDKRSQFITEFRENYFTDLFQTISDNASSVTFDYWDKPYILEKLNKGIVPFPNYIYHKTRMYMEYSPIALIGMNKNNARNRMAKMLAGATIWGIAWAITNKIVKDREDELKELSMKRIDFAFDTTGRLKFYSDDEVERWLRVYDWPIFGDMLYFREIRNGGSDFGDWASDALSMGPLLNIPLAIIGLKTKYQYSKSPASIIGENVSGWIPFSAYIRYLRILKDPIKRQTYSEDYSMFENFINPSIDIIPGLSKELPEQIIKKGMKRGEIRKYDIPTETMKFLFLNVKNINKKEYEDYVNEQFESGKVNKRIRKDELKEIEK